MPGSSRPGRSRAGHQSGPGSRGAPRPGGARRRRDHAVPRGARATADAARAARGVRRPVGARDARRPARRSRGSRPTTSSRLQATVDGMQAARGRRGRPSRRRRGRRLPRPIVELAGNGTLARSGARSSRSPDVHQPRRPGADPQWAADLHDADPRRRAPRATPTRWSPRSNATSRRSREHGRAAPRSAGSARCDRSTASPDRLADALATSRSVARTPAPRRTSRIPRPGRGRSSVAPT